ncbi:MAG: hypothetical protein ACYC1C_10425, partial [Chloroflexota bacterium]
QVAHGFESLAVFAAAGEGARPVSLQGPQWIVMMASAAGYPALLQSEPGGLAALPDLGLPNALAALLLVGGLAVCLWELARAWRRGWGKTTGWEKYALLALWFLVPALVTLRWPAALYTHYLLAVYPLQFLLIGLALARGGEALGRSLARGRADPVLLGTAAALAVALYLGASQGAYFLAHLQQTEQTGQSTFSGAPLGDSEQALAELRQAAPTLGNPPIYVYGYRYRLALDYLAAPDLKLEHVDPPWEVVLPRDLSRGALAMLVANDQEPPAADAAATASRVGGPIEQELRELGFAELADQAVRRADGFAYYRFFSLPAEGARTLADGFAKPARQLVLADGLRLVGLKYPARLQPGAEVALWALWELPSSPSRVDEAVRDNFFVHLVDGKGQVVAQKDGELPQYLGWRSGDLLLTRYTMAVPADRDAGLLWLDVGAYDRFSRIPMPWTGGDAAANPAAEKFGPLKVAPGSVAAPQVEVGATFGGALTLEGYDLEQGAGTAVTLHWLAQEKPGTDYVVSVQVLDSAGRLVAQDDAPPVGGEYPTSYWEAGERVLDRHVLAGPLAGNTLQVVVYGAADGKRLAVRDAAGREVGDSLVLAR